MIRKLIAVVLTIAGCTTLRAEDYSPSAEFKLNIISPALAIYNPSLEVGFAPHSSLAFDYVGIYSGRNWMNSNKPFVLSMNVLGYRYYLARNNTTGFYAGAEFGTDNFKMNKNNAPFIADDSGADRYDVGHGFMAGMVVGYKLPLNKRLSLEVNASFGWHYAMHEVYVDGVRDYPLNPTAEWIPYKGGLHLGYRLWR